MSFLYGAVNQNIKEITHRDDFTTTNVQLFSWNAVTEINTRLSLDPPIHFVSEAATDAEESLWIGVNYMLHLYGCLVGAYEFINELDMADYYRAKFENLLTRYYITNLDGSSPSPVMGEVWPPVEETA